MTAIPPDLPGAKLVEVGLRDLRDGRCPTIEALLVTIGAPRLRDLGLDVPAGVGEPEERLYLHLAAEHGNGAHSRYNSLVRRLVSFERALACAA